MTFNSDWTGQFPAKQHGGTAVGFLIGTLAGLAIAVGVAFMITRAPVPFVNKSASVSPGDLVPETGLLPDPNAPLIASQRPAKAALSAPAGAPIEVAIADRQSPATYLLQAGAFRSADDAGAMRARLALIGFEARILKATVGSNVLYRVRMGPYTALDSMNTARAALADNGIEASVVRQR